MEFVIIFLVLGIIFFSYKCKTTRYYHEWDVGVLVCSIILGISLIALPINYYGIKASITEYHSTQTTLTWARENASEIELAAVQAKAIEANQWLANTQYWNNTMFDIYIPDEIDTLTPIQ